jgi:hypothetical protein
LKQQDRYTDRSRRGETMITDMNAPRSSRCPLMV